MKVSTGSLRKRRLDADMGVIPLNSCPNRLGAHTKASPRLILRLAGSDYQALFCVTFKHEGHELTTRSDARAINHRHRTDQAPALWQPGVLHCAQGCLSMSTARMWYL